MHPFRRGPTHYYSMAASSSEPAASSSASNPLGTTSSMMELSDCPDADVVLRSSDSQSFRVQKAFLMKNSPVLDRFIQTASDHMEGALPVGDGTPLPVVQLPERGAIIYSLLTFLLPVAPVLPLTLEGVMELLSVAQTYEMSHAMVHIRGNISLKVPPLVNKDNALYAYSLALKHGLHQETFHAARITLRSTLTIENLKDKLDMIPGDHLYVAQPYRRS